MTETGRIWTEEFAKKQTVLSEMRPNTSAIESIASSIQKSLSVTADIDMSKYNLDPYIANMSTNKNMAERDSEKEDNTPDDEE